MHARAALNATGGVTERLQGLDETGTHPHVKLRPSFFVMGMWYRFSQFKSWTSCAGQRQGRGIMAGISRGILGAVGVPLTGALDLVSGVTAGIASTTGVARQPSVRHPQRFAGHCL